MELGDAGLSEQPFRTHGDPLAVSPYASHRKAIHFLRSIYRHRHGLGIIQGPTLSGKTTVVREFLKTLDAEVSVARVDGKDLTPDKLLSSVLEQFGYVVELDSVNERSSMLRVFAMQQTASGQPPVLVVDDCQHLKPQTLRLICELADVKANRQSAFRMILVCEQNVEALINLPELQGIAARVTGIHRLRPMTLQESKDYLHEKLYAAGAEEPGDILPAQTCVDIHLAGGGWPGIIDRLALFAVAKATGLPVTSDLVERRQLPEEMRIAARLTYADSERDSARPQLFVSRDGDLLKKIHLDRSRLLIGRSSHNDLALDSKFVSRHHALIVCNGASSLLMDLNSTNGTFVNSRRISNHVLRHDDIIVFGRYRLKFVFPEAERQFELDEAGLAETVIMKTLEDMRHMLTGESTKTMPLDKIHQLAASE